MHNIDTYTGPSFSLQNRSARIVWNLVYILFFKYSPKPFHLWRSFILRCFGAKIGNNVHIYPKVKIWAPWNIELKDNSSVANDVILYSQGKITIGKRTAISQGTHLCAGTHDYTKPGFPIITKPIVIKDNVWIAAEVFIHPGVLIETGCVVGARSVVISNLPEWMVCTGHPCKAIKVNIAKSRL